MITREDHDWGVVLIARPFTGSLGTLQIRSEIHTPKASKGPVAKIACSGTTMAAPMTVVEARTWANTLQAVISQTSEVVEELKKPKRKRKP